MRAVDLFAGPGGWDEGLRLLGHENVLGIELDGAACETAQAAGHARLQADVATLDPAECLPVDLLVASPPCQGWSVAGKRKGRHDQEHVEMCAHELAVGSDTRAEHAANCGDPRSILVVEPLRWALELSPRWVVCEQVPTVLGLWTLYAELLEMYGYHTWAGVLSAEQYGVPQTRQRAFLLACNTGPPAPPAPTHQRYVFPRKRRREEQEALALDDAVPARIVHPDDRELLPWVSMAEALGWAPEERVGFPRRADRDLTREYRERDLRSASDPAFNLTEKARSWTRRRPEAMRQNKLSKATVRLVDEPAPTIMGGHSSNDRAWVFARPATTIAGDPRVFQPGGHIAHDGRDNARMGQRSGNAIRVTLEEAAVLQGFRADYPFAGNKTKRFEQVGNAVPPAFGAAVIGELLRA